LRITMDARATDRTPHEKNMGERIGESLDEDVIDSAMTNRPQLSAGVWLENILNQRESSGNKLRTTADPSDEESEEDIIPDEYALGASKVKSDEDVTKATRDYKNSSYTSSSTTTSFTNSGSSTRSKPHHQESESKRLRDSDATTSYTQSGRQERQMEANRVRARDIRKRKKNMVEEMNREIVKLTMANQQLRSQTQIQHAEIYMLRSIQGVTPNHSVSTAC